jgi:hypothetical protein
LTEPWPRFDQVRPSQSWSKLVKASQTKTSKKYWRPRWG